MTPPKLSPQARRLRTIIVTLPIIVGTSFVLYKRLALGEPQRKFPDDPANSKGKLIELQPGRFVGSEEPDAERR